MTPFEYPHRRLATDRFSYLHKPVSEKQNGPKKIASTKLWRSFLRAIRKIIPVSRKTFRPSNKTFSSTNTFPFLKTSGRSLPGPPLRPPYCFLPKTLVCVKNYTKSTIQIPDTKIQTGNQQEWTLSRTRLANGVIKITKTLSSPVTKYRDAAGRYHG